MLVLKALAILIVTGLAGCASTVRGYSDAELCGHKATMPDYNVWSSARDAEMAKRGTNCNTPEAEANILFRKSGGWKVVKPEWLPEKGAEWAVLDCKAKAAVASGYDWIADASAKGDALRNCLQAYGLGR